jgi:hypothetical protein
MRTERRTFKDSAYRAPLALRRTAESGDDYAPGRRENSAPRSALFYGRRSRDRRDDAETSRCPTEISPRPCLPTPRSVGDVAQRLATAIAPMSGSAVTNFEDW